MFVLYNMFFKGYLEDATLNKHMTSRVGPILTLGALFDKLGRGLLGDATYQISML